MLFRGHLWLGLKEAETFHGGGFSCRTWAERARERKLPSGMLQILHGFYVEHGYRLAAFNWYRFVLTTPYMPSHFLLPWILLCIKFLGVCVRVPCMKNVFSEFFPSTENLKLSIHILARKKSETENGPRFEMTKMMLRMVLFWKINSQK